MEKQLKPAIRFKGFTDPWELRKFSDLAETRRGLTYNPSSISDSGIRVLRSSNIAEDQFIYGEDDVFVEPDAVNIPKVTQGDILITSANGSTRLIGKHAIIRDIPNNSAVHGGFMLLAVARNPEFVNALMSAPWYTKFISLYVAGGNGAIGNLNKSDLDDQDVYVPENTEQMVIGQYFSQLDHLITLHQRESYKYSLCHHDLSDVLECLLTIYWEQRKLGEVGSVSMCRRIFKEQTSESGDIPFYKIGTFGGQPDAYISRELFAEYKAKYPYPKEGDILLSASGSIGRTVEFSGKNEYFQDSNIVWLSHDDNRDNAFLKCFYSIVKWAGIEGSTIKRLYNDNILNTKIILPSVDEQKQIGAFFKELDTLITLHQRKSPH